MQEQITYYHDTRKVEIALIEAGATYTSRGFDIHNKPVWFAQANPLTEKIPAITFGGPRVLPEEPSPLSFKLTESHVILEFIADLFPNSCLLPSVSDPTARARVRLFMDVAVRDLETTLFDRTCGAQEALGNLVRVLQRIQILLPDGEGLGEGYAIGKEFTNADCAIAPWLANIELAIRTGIGRDGPGTGAVLGEILAEKRFDRLRRYKDAVLGRESVKKVMDLEYMEGVWRARYSQK